MLISYFLYKPTFYANKLFSKMYRLAQGRPSRPLAKPGLSKSGSAALGMWPWAPDTTGLRGGLSRSPYLHTQLLEAIKQLAGGLTAYSNSLRRAKWAISGPGSGMGALWDKQLLSSFGKH